MTTKVTREQLPTCIRCDVMMELPGHVASVNIKGGKHIEGPVCEECLLVMIQDPHQFFDAFETVKLDVYRRTVSWVVILLMVAAIVLSVYSIVSR